MKFNKFFVTFLSAILLIYAANNIFCLIFKNKKNKITQQTVKDLTGQITIENTVFVFDIHNVIVDFSLGKAIKRAIKIPNKKDFYKKYKEYDAQDEDNKKGIENFALKDNDDKTNEKIIKVLNPHKPNKKTVQIIADLHKRGFRIFGCSNIGVESYKYMCQEYPETFRYLEQCRTTNEDNDYIKKNNPAAYNETIEIIRDALGDNFSNIKYIIFVDDKKSNIKVATETNSKFHGIEFQSAKRFKRALKKIGAL